jgi:hypothetical protein
VNRKILFAALGLSSALAAATPTWNVVHGPSATGNWLSAVSCAGRSFCAAGGQSGSEHTLAEVWNGTGWRVTPTPKLRAKESFFSDVDCVSRDWCIAIGSTGSGGNLVEHWNGVAWRVMPAPAGSWSGGALSCVSASYCVAVSGIETGSTDDATAAIWNGHHWIATSVPGALGEQLNDVSCASQGLCVAVGVSEGTFHPLCGAVEWDEVGALAPDGNARILNGGFLFVVQWVPGSRRSWRHARGSRIRREVGRETVVRRQCKSAKQTSDSFFDTSCWSNDRCVIVGQGLSSGSRYSQPIAFEWHGKSIFEHHDSKGVGRWDIGRSGCQRLGGSCSWFYWRVSIGRPNR